MSKYGGYRRENAAPLVGDRPHASDTYFWMAIVKPRKGAWLTLIRAGPHLLIWINFNTIMISNYIRYKVWAEIIYPFPDSKVHGANMGLIWVPSAPDGPHVCPMNLVISTPSEEQYYRHAVRILLCLCSFCVRSFACIYYCGAYLVVDIIAVRSQRIHQIYS